MHRFWPVVEPILTVLRSRSIVQIGGDERTTDDLNRFAREHGAAVHVAEAAPRRERGSDAEVERFLGVTSRDLAFGAVPGQEGLGVLCERRLLAALLRSAAGDGAEEGAGL